MKEFFKGCVFYFINHVLNKIPSRHIRMFFYTLLSKGGISRKASIGLGVKFLDIRNIIIGDYVNVNFDSILDGRGGRIKISKNVDIAPQVNIWSLEHDPQSISHESRSGEVTVGENCWIANRVTILPNSIIGANCVIGAGSLVKGVYCDESIIVGYKAKKIKSKENNSKFQLRSIRIFR
jgi:acetyltransferase-like isoleucine patch superfamily enzyme